MTDTADILYMPNGYRFTFLLASFTKHILVHCKMTPRERLKLLEGLERLTDAYLTPEVLASIDPACNVAVKMIGEANKLGPKDAYAILTRCDVFENFVRLNPTLLKRALQ